MSVSSIKVPAPFFSVLFFEEGDPADERYEAEAEHYEAIPQRMASHPLPTALTTS